MGRYGTFEVEGLWVDAWFESYSPKVAALFRDEDGVEIPDEPGDYDPPRTFVPITYSTSARAMRERLQLLGVREGHRSDLVEAAWFVALDAEGETRVDLVEALDAWVREVSDPPGNGWVGPATEFVQHHMSAMRAPIFSTLRFVLDQVPDQFRVSLDLGQVWGLHGQSPTPTFCADARGEVLDGVDSSVSTIVLTEGSTDAAILERAVRVLRPHLLGFVTFLDYSAKPQGGADSVVRGLKAFAAAGVANRVLGLLDNDVAGAEAMRQIAGVALPSRKKAIQLPNLSLARAYPTLGTEGLTTKDVNGSAVSIELFLGEDVLRNSAGDLTPVQMTAWNEQHHSFQGAITDKSAIQKRFFTKAGSADPSTVDRESWQDLDDLLQHLLDSL